MTDSATPNGGIDVALTAYNVINPYLDGLVFTHVNTYPPPSNVAIYAAEISGMLGNATRYVILVVDPIFPNGTPFFPREAKATDLRWVNMQTAALKDRLTAESGEPKALRPQRWAYNPRVIAQALGREIRFVAVHRTDDRTYYEVEETSDESLTQVNFKMELLNNPAKTGKWQHYDHISLPGAFDTYNCQIRIQPFTFTRRPGEVVGGNNAPRDHSKGDTSIRGRA